MNVAPPRHDAPMAEIDLVYTFMRRQFGLITRTQALECGLTPRQIAWFVTRGRWRLVRPDVYEVAGSPPTWEQSVLAAVLAGGDGVAVSHGTAGRLRTLKHVSETTSRSSRRSGATSGSMVSSVIGLERCSTPTSRSIDRSRRPRSPGRSSTCRVGSASGSLARLSTMRFGDGSLTSATCAAPRVDSGARRVGR